MRLCQGHRHRTHYSILYVALQILAHCSVPICAHNVQEGLELRKQIAVAFTVQAGQNRTKELVYQCNRIHRGRVQVTAKGWGPLSFFNGQV